MTAFIDASVFAGTRGGSCSGHSAGAPGSPATSKEHRAAANLRSSFRQAVEETKLAEAALKREKLHRDALLAQVHLQKRLDF